MKTKVLDPIRFNQWITDIVAKQRVYGVQAKGERFVFDTLLRAEDLRLDYDVTLLPPKKYLQPPKETLLKFDREGSFKSVWNEERFVLLGVHPYDLAAINQMDTVFQSEHQDNHYLAYRERATIIASDLVNISSTCFAGCLNTATLEDGTGCDLRLSKLPGGHYLVEPCTAKGEALMQTAVNAPDATDQEFAERAVLWRANREQTRRQKLHMDGQDLPGLLGQSYHHPIWAEKSEHCYSCGSCVMVCPTCYCFNVADNIEWNLRQGSRVREWDGCMLTGFAKVAGGHNFRIRKAARFRHRFFRKGKYMWDRFQQIACVGCGRCTTACTTNIANPVEIYNRLWEDYRAST